MGVFKIPIEVGDPAGQSYQSVDAMVDTGATNTMFPAKLLHKLGVTPYKKSIFELGDGRQVEFEVGRTWVKVDGQQEFTQVIFGNDDAEALLGAVTLEEMALSVDPVRRRLVPVNKYLL
jgi:aspartyl protease family protein